jgi:4'-phosphopantetheinyl transferase
VDPSQIFVDCIELDLTDPAENIAIASEQERRRAARYRHAIDSRRFLARRAQARLILAELLSRPAHRITFCVGPFGKPAVEGSAARFSTSHSRGLLLIAIGADRELGCDIEYCDPDRDLTLLTPMTFTQGEMVWFSSLRDDLKADAFYDRWTRKEAYLKAVGTGLSTPMTDFSITTDPFRIVTHGGSTGDWSTQFWCPRPGYQAAVVAQGRGRRIRERGSPAMRMPGTIEVGV